MHISHTLLAVYADTASTSEGDLIKLVLLLAGPAFFMVMWGRYRNSRQRHFHEKETKAQTANLVSHDRKVGERRGVSASRISGANSTRVKGARN
ncbi:hypothetical protein [Timonella sp. A28]|uniref:hypothetical protein n=1 Tax=Timonella sp. A28 TaxID=3442640 RepID=UPI003EB7FF67